MRMPWPWLRGQLSRSNCENSGIKLCTPHRLPRPPSLHNNWNCSKGDWRWDNEIDFQRHLPPVALPHTPRSLCCCPSHGCQVIRQTKHTHTTHFPGTCMLTFRELTHTHGHTLTLQSHMIYFHSLVFTHRHTHVVIHPSPPPPTPSPSCCLSVTCWTPSHTPLSLSQTNTKSVCPSGSKCHRGPAAAARGNRTLGEDERLVLNAAGTTSRHS